MTKFTRDAVSEALHAAVAAKGEDYVYPGWNEGCYYADPEEHKAPSCIVGHVVAALDPNTFRSWAEFEAQEGGDSFPASEMDTPRRYAEEEICDEDELLVGYGEPQKVREAFEVDEVTKNALSVAQRIQDMGRSWADAQESFDRTMRGEDAESVRAEIMAR